MKLSQRGKDQLDTFLYALSQFSRYTRPGEGACQIKREARIVCSRKYPELLRRQRQSLEGLFPDLNNLEVISIKLGCQIPLLPSQLQTTARQLNWVGASQIAGAVLAIPAVGRPDLAPLAVEQSLSPSPRGFRRPPRTRMIENVLPETVDFLYNAFSGPASTKLSGQAASSLASSCRC